MLMMFISQDSFKPVQDVQTVERHWMHPAVLYGRMREKVWGKRLDLLYTITLQVLDFLSDFVEEESDQEALEKPTPLSYKR